VDVLFVVTNPTVADHVTTALTGVEEVAITTVATPDRAVGVLDDGREFDVIVADADTAPAGGFYLCREVKSRGWTGRDVPPVVLLLARDQDRYLASWAQADAYCLKPLDPFDLAAAVEAVAAGRRPPALPGIGAEPMPSPFDTAPALEELSGEASHDTDETATGLGTESEPDEAHRDDDEPAQAPGQAGHGKEAAAADTARR
jgi:DNA-binding response OmpR family regulator